MRRKIFRVFIPTPFLNTPRFCRRVGATSSFLSGIILRGKVWGFISLLCVIYFVAGESVAFSEDRPMAPDTKSYREVAHAFCSLSEDGNTDDAAFELWAYSRPEGDRIASVLKAKHIKSGATFLFSNESRAVFLWKSGDGIPLLFDTFADFVAYGKSFLSPSDIQFLADEKAIRQCFIAGKIREFFNLN